MARPNPPRLAAAAAAFARAALRPERPDRLPRAMVAMAAWGPTMAGAIAAATARYPGAPAVIDDRGSLTFSELWTATDGIARGLRRRGVETTSTVGILARNHRGFVMDVVAAAKLGTDMVFLNIIGEKDHIVPPAAIEVLTSLVGSEDVEELRLPAGHVGLVVGKSAQRRNLPAMAGWIERHSEPLS